MAGPDRRWGLDAEQRLAALAALDLVPGLADPVFAPYARLVQRLLGAPTALVSFVTADRQLFAASVGLDEPWASRAQTPLELSFCQHVVTGDAPLVVTDARDDERVRDNPAVEQLGVRAYLGTPLRAPRGEPLGSLCAVDTEPRAWTDEQLATLRDVADAAGAAIALRIAEHRRRIEARDASHELRTPITAMRAELEDMAAWPEATEATRAGLAVAVGHLGTLEHVVDRLLARSRAQLLEAHEDTDLVELAHAVAARWGVAVDAPEPVRARIAVDSTRVALDALVERALATGSGSVLLQVTATAGACRLTVRSGGDGDEPAPDRAPELAGVAHQLAARAGGRLLTDPVTGAVELLLPRT